MRKSLLAGLVLAVAAALVVWLSNAFGLELESVTLLGAALGAVVALVPDESPTFRLAGFTAGFVAAWIGYVLRAAVLPDTAGGRGVAVGMVMLACVAVTAATRTRVPLWATLLGAAAMVGGYEYTFSAAPPEVASTSLTAATSLLVTVAVGFMVVALVAPVDRAEQKPRPPEPPAAPDDDATSLDDMMKETAQ
jgi:hypothetical protein